MITEKNTALHTNPDPITGAPASHPGATGIGAASGAATGAAIGAIGGPVGAAIGATVGGFVGGYLGHEIGEWSDPSDQVYWKENYAKSGRYGGDTVDFDRDLEPAYRYGSNMGMRDASVTGVAGGPVVAPSRTRSTFESIEAKAREEWDAIRGKSKMTYNQARSAMSDAYNRKVNSRSADE